MPIVQFVQPVIVLLEARTVQFVLQELNLMFLEAPIVLFAMPGLFLLPEALAAPCVLQELFHPVELQIAQTVLRVNIHL